MNYKFSKIIILLFLLFNATVFADSDYAYRVEFTGINDEDTLCLLRQESQLITLQETPPQTAAGLQKRIDDDIVVLLKALQSRAYYNPRIEPLINRSACPFVITLSIEPGPIYSFRSFQVIPDPDAQNCCESCNGINLDDLGIELGLPALPAAIIEAEETLIKTLETKGYPLAKLTKREVIADIQTETVSVNLVLNCGPQAFFGKTDVCGGDSLLPIFFCRKIAWREGQLYRPSLVQRTINSLELSGLFSTISVTHDEETLEDGSLPMHITVAEAKTRSIGFGLGYATTLGAGMNAEWENRNISGRGDKLSFVANLWQIKQEGFVRYTFPDFLQPRQDFIWTAEVEHEEVKAFRVVSFNVSGIVERQLHDRLRVSGGAMYSKLRTTHSNNNRTFTLLKTPFQ